MRRRKRLVYPIGERTRFSAGLGDQARDTCSEMIGTTKEPAAAWVAAALGLAAGKGVIRIESLGRADGIPISRSTSWFEADRFEGIAELFSNTGSVTAALAGFGVSDYRRASTSIEARHAEEADTRELQLAPGAIVIVTRAMNCDLSGRPVQCSATRFAADRVELVVETTARSDK